MALAAFLLLFGVAPATDGAVPPAGRVTFSDGEAWEGVLRWSPQTRIRLHAKRTLHAVSPGDVASIRMHPQDERMEQKWRFPIAGSPRKEKWGEPYPVRHLGSTLVMRDGTTLTGHLYTCPLYVEGDSGTRKVVLLAKQRGKPGETLDSLRYVTCVVFGREVPQSLGCTLRIVGVPEGVKARAAAIEGPGMIRVDGRQVGSSLRLTYMRAGRVFPAILSGSRAVVAWPAADEHAVERVMSAGSHIRDFFDRHDILGAFADGNTIYSLMLLRRLGGTTLGAKRRFPWRLGVFRWHVTGDGGMMLAARAYLFRGILAQNESPPDVELSETWWKACAPPEDDAEIPWTAL